MRYKNVFIEGIAYTLPEQIVTSDDIERQLEPVYRRLRLPEGRLELMTGIRQRRFWPEGTMPGTISVQSAEKVLAASDVDRVDVGALVHGSVCRDFLEPATACGIHHRLGLSDRCMTFDVSNACLGLLNGMVQVANMIELGDIRAGLVVGTESGRELVETTIQTLNADQSLTREQSKSAIASLTIGSASCAVLLVNRDLTQTGNELVATTVRTNSQYHNLCHSGRDSAVGTGMRPLMDTDSEKLMHEGISIGAITFRSLLDEAGWARQELDKIFCHQVGSAHRKLMLDALEVDPGIDYTTFEWLGNTGAVALPITMAVGIENGHLAPGDRVGMLGIGSGINCLMLAIRFQSQIGQ